MILRDFPVKRKEIMEEGFALYLQQLQRESRHPYKIPFVLSPPGVSRNLDFPHPKPSSSSWLLPLTCSLSSLLFPPQSIALIFSCRVTFSLGRLSIQLQLYLQSHQHCKLADLKPRYCLLQWKFWGQILINEHFINLIRFWGRKFPWASKLRKTIYWRPLEEINS